MGRKDASTARTPVDQYRKQIGKRSEEKFVCLMKNLWFFEASAACLTKCIILLQKVHVACEWYKIMHALGKHFLYTVD